MLLVRMRRYWNFPIAYKVALIEAGLLLVFAQFLIKLIPYRWWSISLGPVTRPQADEPPPANQQAVKTVGQVIDSAARRLPWEAVCLPRAMVTKWMLARREISSTMFLGIRRQIKAGAKEADGDKETDLHAWLRVGDQTVCGGEVADQFTVIACYGPKLRLDSASR